MKNRINIVVACGGGIFTTTVVTEKIQEILKKEKIANSISPHKITEIANITGADLIVVGPGDDRRAALSVACSLHPLGRGFDVAPVDAVDYVEVFAQPDVHDSSVWAQEDVLDGEPLVEHIIRRLAPQVGQLIINANQNHDIYAGFGYPGGVRINEPGRTLWLRADLQF